jgi:hypothetical protein
LYPYDFRPKFSGINHREVFVVMPFDKQYDDIFTKLIEPSVERANERLERKGYDKSQELYAYRTKDDIRTTSGWTNVLEHLTTAQIVLGVLTGDNINVFYELGIAHATQQISRQILIAEKGYKPSFDTKDLIYCPYDKDELKENIDDLSIKIADAIEYYEFENEKIIHRARMFVSPYGLEVMLAYGVRRNFNVPIYEEAKEEYEKKHRKGSHKRHIEGITNLCQCRLLALNTKSLRLEDVGTEVKYSYYWTNLGNDLLHYMEIINKETVIHRRSGSPIVI